MASAKEDRAIKDLLAKAGAELGSSRTWRRTSISSSPQAAAVLKRGKNTDTTAALDVESSEEELFPEGRTAKGGGDGDGDGGGRESKGSSIENAARESRLSVNI